MSRDVRQPTTSESTFARSGPKGISEFGLRNSDLEDTDCLVFPKSEIRNRQIREDPEKPRRPVRIKPVRTQKLLWGPDCFEWPQTQEVSPAWCSRSSPS